MAIASKSKLTLWVDREAGRFGKEWAKQHHASLSQLVTDYLARLKATSESRPPVTPMVRRLSGVLKGRAPLKLPYRKHLEKKYLEP